MHTLEVAYADHFQPSKGCCQHQKHGIRFSDAEFVLFDPLALTSEDTEAEGEERLVSMGMDSTGRLLVVVYTYRGDDIRLISARLATTKERDNYENRI
jgi:uncharacterized protein